MTPRKIGMWPITGLPYAQVGDDIGSLVIERLCKLRSPKLLDGDVLVIAQKFVSKAEGAVVDLSTVTPSLQAEELARVTGRDPRYCQVVVDEGVVLSTMGSVIVTRHRRLGLVLTSAGIDRSNTGPNPNLVTLLPRNPDASARAIRKKIYNSTGKTVAVVISDSLGRPDRDGSVGMAIGLCGMLPLEAGTSTDLFGKPQRSRIAVVDELAAAASLLMGQGSEGVPVVLIRGARYTADEDGSLQKLLLNGRTK